MPDYQVVEIGDSDIDALQNLADESSAEGHDFMQRTVNEWRSGVNTFSKSGEKLWGLAVEGKIVAIGGLNQDPYVDDETVGRVRHVYVAKKCRGQGLSKTLMRIIMDAAKARFQTLRLSTNNPIAASLYESLGFEKTDGPKATHAGSADTRRPSQRTPARRR